MDQNQTTTGTPEGEVAPTGGSSPLPLVVGFLALLVIALIMWFGMMKSTPAPESATEPVGIVAPTDPSQVPVGANDTVGEALKAQGTSDEVADIQADLDATDMKVLDGIDQI